MVAAALPLVVAAATAIHATVIATGLAAAAAAAAAAGAVPAFVVTAFRESTGFTWKHQRKGGTTCPASEHRSIGRQGIRT